MDGDFSYCTRLITLQILTCQILMVIAANTKIEGTLECTPPRHTAITCSTTKLPTVTDGSFDCAPNTDVSIGEVCALSCNGGFCAADSNQVVCEAGTTDQEGKWSEGSFVCRAVTCQEFHLPTVDDGFFNCSGYSVGDQCNLTCNDGYQPSLAKYTVCEEYDDHKANWTVRNFQCAEILCHKVHLPTVYAGFFNCSSFSVGDQCSLTCDDGYFPTSSKKTVCEEYDNNKINWTVENFMCSGIKCSTTNLPTVHEGSFDCAPNSSVSMGEACTLTCNDGLYPAYSRQSVCEAGIPNQGGVWSNGTFVCRHLECNNWNEWNGSEYKYISAQQTWEGSLQLCESENSHLVTVENKEENEFVRRMVWHCNQYRFVWIGLNDRITEGTREWIDSTVSTYRNWYEGQPDGEDAEDCVCMLGSHGEWYDLSCTSYERDAVCERNKYPLT